MLFLIFNLKNVLNYINNQEFIDEKNNFKVSARKIAMTLNLIKVTFFKAVKYSFIFSINFIFFLSTYIYMYYKFIMVRYVYKHWFYISTFNHFVFYQFIAITISLMFMPAIVQTSDINSILIAWFLFQILIYLLITGFVYLLNRNTYGHNLASLSRFWKRTFMVFWLLEAFLFACFSFLLLNEGQDLWVAKDSLKFFKTHHFSVPQFIFRLSILCLSIVALYYLLISIESHILITKPNKIVSFILILSCLSEVYFTGVVSHYLYVVFYETPSIKSKLSSEFRRLRIFNQFLLICSLAKFWHFVFVLFSWFITIPSLTPRKNNQYGVILLSLQNLVAIYFLTVLMALPYIKYLHHNNLEFACNLWSFSKFNQSFKFIIDTAIQLYTFM